MWAPWRGAKYTIRGKVVASPKSGPWWILCGPCCSWLVLTPKVLQLCTNHLVWDVCRPMWVSEACQFFLVPSWNSNTPLYPSKCCELGNMPQLLPLPMSCTWTHFWILQGVGSASHMKCGHQHPIFNPIPLPFNSMDYDAPVISPYHVLILPCPFCHNGFDPTWDCKLASCKHTYHS